MKKEINKYGTIFYYGDNGFIHREDGPAIECANGYKSYWYNGDYYPEIKTDEEWIRFVKLMVFI